MARAQAKLVSSSPDGDGMDATYEVTIYGRDIPTPVRISVSVDFDGSENPTQYKKKIMDAVRAAGIRVGATIAPNQVRFPPMEIG